MSSERIGILQEIDSDWEGFVRRILEGDVDQFDFQISSQEIQNTAPWDEEVFGTQSSREGSVPDHELPIGQSAAEVNVQESQLSHVTDASAGTLECGTDLHCGLDESSQNSSSSSGSDFLGFENTSSQGSVGAHSLHQDNDEDSLYPQGEKGDVKPQQTEDIGEPSQCGLCRTLENQSESDFTEQQDSHELSDELSDATTERDSSEISQQTENRDASMEQVMSGDIDTGTCAESDITADLQRTCDDVSSIQGKDDNVTTFNDVTKDRGGVGDVTVTKDRGTIDDVAADHGSVNEVTKIEGIFDDVTTDQATFGDVIGDLETADDVITDQGPVDDVIADQGPVDDVITGPEADISNDVTDSKTDGPEITDDVTNSKTADDVITDQHPVDVITGPGTTDDVTDSETDDHDVITDKRTVDDQGNTDDVATDQRTVDDITGTVNQGAVCVRADQSKAAGVTENQEAVDEITNNQEAVDIGTKHGNHDSDIANSTQDSSSLRIVSVESWADVQAETKSMSWHDDSMSAEWPENISQVSATGEESLLPIRDDPPQAGGDTTEANEKKSEDIKLHATDATTGSCLHKEHSRKDDQHDSSSVVTPKEAPAPFVDEDSGIYNVVHEGCSLNDSTNMGEGYLNCTSTPRAILTSTPLVKPEVPVPNDAATRRKQVDFPMSGMKGGLTCALNTVMDVSHEHEDMICDGEDIVVDAREALDNILAEVASIDSCDSQFVETMDMLKSLNAGQLPDKTPVAPQKEVGDETSASSCTKADHASSGSSSSGLMKDHCYTRRPDTTSTSCSGGQHPEASSAESDSALTEDDMADLLSPRVSAQTSTVRVDPEVGVLLRIPESETETKQAAKKPAKCECCKCRPGHKVPEYRGPITKSVDSIDRTFQLKIEQDDAGHYIPSKEDSEQLRQIKAWIETLSKLRVHCDYIPQKMFIRAERLGQPIKQDASHDLGTVDLTCELIDPSGIPLKKSVWKPVTVHLDNAHNALVHHVSMVCTSRSMATYGFSPFHGLLLPCVLYEDHKFYVYKHIHECFIKVLCGRGRSPRWTLRKFDLDYNCFLDLPGLNAAMSSMHVYMGPGNFKVIREDAAETVHGWHFECKRQGWVDPVDSIPGPAGKPKKLKKAKNVAKSSSSPQASNSTATLEHCPPQKQPVAVSQEELEEATLSLLQLSESRPGSSEPNSADQQQLSDQHIKVEPSIDATSSSTFAPKTATTVEQPISSSATFLPASSQEHVGTTSVVVSNQSRDITPQTVTDYKAAGCQEKQKVAASSCTDLASAVASPCKAAEHHTDEKSDAGQVGELPTKTCGDGPVPGIAVPVENMSTQTAAEFSPDEPDAEEGELFIDIDNDGTSDTEKEHSTKMLCVTPDVSQANVTDSRADGSSAADASTLQSDKGEILRPKFRVISPVANTKPLDTIAGTTKIIATHAPWDWQKVVVQPRVWPQDNKDTTVDGSTSSSHSSLNTAAGQSPGRDVESVSRAAGVPVSVPSGETRVLHLPGGSICMFSSNSEPTVTPLPSNSKVVRPRPLRPVPQMPVLQPFPSTSTVPVLVMPGQGQAEGSPFTVKHSLARGTKAVLRDANKTPSSVGQKVVKMFVNQDGHKTVILGKTTTQSGSDSMVSRVITSTRPPPPLGTTARKTPGVSVLKSFFDPGPRPLLKFAPLKTTENIVLTSSAPHHSASPTYTQRGSHPSGGDLSPLDLRCAGKRARSPDPLVGRSPQEPLAKHFKASPVNSLISPAGSAASPSVNSILSSAEWQIRGAFAQVHKELSTVQEEIDRMRQEVQQTRSERINMEQRLDALRQAAARKNTGFQGRPRV